MSRPESITVIPVTRVPVRAGLQAVLVETKVRDLLDNAEAAIAAARAAPRNELLSAEGETPTAAVAGFDVDVYFVYEHGVIR